MFINLFLERIFLYVHRNCVKIIESINQSINTTFSEHKKKQTPILNLLKKNCIKKKNLSISQNLTNNYLLHNFNLLGSGLKKVNIKNTSRINSKNKKISQIILKNIDLKNYKLLNWQLDFKNNFEWNVKIPSKKIKFMNIPKADIKIPWEFARMQHLPQLAIYAAKIKKKDYSKANKIFKEFENQILDFISFNPPKYGVNWICTMDVSIRISNWLIAKDVFKSAGFDLSDKVNKIFKNSVYDHKNFILKNLEYSSYRNNHYIADLCGLSIIARYLPQSKFSDSLIAFVSQELNKEIFLQFNDDGSSIEGSTSYHKFSLEMILYSSAFILSLEQTRLKRLKKNINSKLIKTNLVSPKLDEKKFQIFLIKNKYFKQKFFSTFPEKYFDRLIKIFDFFLNTTTSKKQIIQVGDNDSGKFLNFTPIFYNEKMNNNQKDYFENRESVNYIFDLADSWGLYKNFNFNKDLSFEKSLIKTLLGKIQFNKPSNSLKKKYKQNNYFDYKKSFYQLKSSILKNKEFNEIQYEFKANKSIMNNIELNYFKDFGIFILKNKKLFFSLRVISTYDKKFTSHYHFDQLSNILILNNKNLIIDPGTFTYSGNIKYRNYFRSYKAHFSPINIKFEKDLDIFSKIDHPTFKSLIMGKYCYLVGTTIKNNFYYSGYIYENNKIKIFHISNEKSFKNMQKNYYSPGYGLIKKLKFHEKFFSNIV
jgi:hypothetical protein